MTKNEVLSSLCLLSHTLTEWKNNPEESALHYEQAREMVYKLQTGIAMTDDNEAKAYA